MADDPIQGNQGGTSKRLEELKQMNLEGAKTKAMLQGLAGAFKKFDDEIKSGINSSELLTGSAKNLNSSYKQNIDLAKKLSGFTVAQLKDSKTRNAFENQVLKAQGEQASIQAEISALTLEQNRLSQIDYNLQEDKSKKVQKQKELRKEVLKLITEAKNVEKEQSAIAVDKAALAAKAYARQGQASLEREATQAKINDLLEKGVDASTEEFQNLQKQLQTQLNNEEAAARVVARAQESRDIAEENILNAQILVDEKKKELVQQNEQVKAAQELTEENKNQLEATKELIGVNEKAANAIEVGLNHAKGLSEEIEKVNNATPKFIEAFEKFGAVASGIPIIGSAISFLTGGISDASKKFKELRAEGKGAGKAIAQAFSGFAFAGLTAALTAFISLAVDGAKKSSEAIVKLNKSVAGSMVNMQAQMSRVSAAAGKFSVPLSEATATIAGLNDSLGMSLDFTKETTEQAIKLANKYGVSVDAVAHIVKNSAANKKTMTETVDAVTAGVARFNEMNNVSISTKAIFEDIGKASATTLRGIGKQPGALAAAAASARSLGMSMEDIRSASESTTDFQKSLTDEMTTEMMLGKQLNLNKLREAALTGDVKTQAEEMKRLVMENQGRIGNNVKLQEQFAATLGISRDQYNDMLTTQDAMSVLTSKSGAAEAANDKARKMSNEEIAASIEKTTSKLTTLGSKIEKFQENMALGANSFASDLLDGFDDGFMAGMYNVGKMMWKEISTAFDEGFDYFKSGSNVGRFLGVLAVGGGAAITIKAAKGIFGGIKSFLGLGGNKPSGNAMDPIHTVSGGTGDIVDSLTRNLRPRSVKSMKFTKGFSKIFGGRNTIVGKQLRNMAAMFGKRSSMFKQVFSGMSKTFKAGGPKIFSGISNLFKTGGPKILSGLTNSLGKIGPGLSKVAGPLLGKIMAPLELVMGGITGVNQVKDLTAAQKKEQGIKESMGTTEAGIVGALTGNANKGSMFSEKLGIEKGGAGDEALGIATSGLRGAATGAAIGSVIPVVGTAVGAVVGGAIGVVSEGFKVFSDPNSKLRKGLSEFATATYDKAALIGNKIKKGAIMVGTKIKDFALGVKKKAVEVAGNIKDFAVGVKNKAFAFASSVGKGISNFATSAKQKAFAFASSVGEGISNFATSAKQKAVELASAVGEGISNFASSTKEKISGFASTVGAGIMSFASTAKNKAQELAGAIGEKVGVIRDRVGDFIEANGGILGGMRAAAAGLASQAKKWLGSAYESVMNFVTGDKAKSATPKVKQEKIKKVTTPLMQMSKDQAKTFTTAINTALSKGADTTIKAMNSLGEVLEEPLMLGATAANAQMEELKKLKAEGDKQHKAEIMELKNQTALLYEYIMKPQKSVIKMNTFKVGQSLTRV